MVIIVGAVRTLISGLLTGTVIIAFRWLTESAQIMLTPMEGPEAFEWLSWPYRLALPIAGGLLTSIAPEVTGIGYDTGELTLLGEMALGALVMVAAVKLIATVACISLDLPGGLIGPTLVMGAAAGGARVVLVTGSDKAVPGNVYGVLTRDRIEAGVRYRI